MEPYLSLEQFLDSPVSKTVAKHDSEQEDKAPHPFWDIDRPAINEHLSEISTLVKQPLRTVPDGDEELAHLLDTAERLPQVPRIKPTKVAFLGAQGAGKSLLINALFDCDGLSLTGADGGACTASIVRYAYYPGKERRFCAQVKFLDSKKLSAMIQEHAKSYYNYHNDDEDSDDEKDPRIKVPCQDDLDRRLRDTALDIFETLFGSKDDFLESWDPRSYRSGEFVSLCLLKCEEALSNIGLEQNIKSYFSQDQHDLLQQIRPFLTTVPGQICLWPLVDNVCIRLTHPLLQHGIEIIDLPGSGDTNASRARHADEIRDSVDVLVVLADTIRITTDESFISKVRGGILTHGPERVKLVATKIDALSQNQLTQCSGDIYDEMKSKIADIEDQIAAAEEEGNGKEVALGKYKTYLERYLKAYKINQRAHDITKTMSTNLQRWSTGDASEIFHISAASYMDWIKRDKIIFGNQPALSALKTGIPAIRKLLYHLPSQQNLVEISTHIHIAVPTFIEKIKRAATQSDRDAGFRTLADEFDTQVLGMMNLLLKQAKHSFPKILAKSVDFVRADTSAYKTKVQKTVKHNWFLFKGQTWNRVLKSRGLIVKGASKAQGLKDGCDWVGDIASIMAPGFRRWADIHASSMKHMGLSLTDAVDSIHRRGCEVMDESAANLLIVDKAKRKWSFYRDKLRIKVKTLMEEVSNLETRSRFYATKEAHQENNLIAELTDDIFDEVFDSLPPIKEPTTTQKSSKASANPPKVRYITPKIKHQKEELERLLLGQKNHVVDNAFHQFHTQFDKAMAELLNKHFGEMTKHLEIYSKWLRDQAPIDYPITPFGESIRAELQQLIPTLEEKSQALKDLLPKSLKQEHELSPDSMDTFNGVHGHGQGASLEQLYDKYSEGKQTHNGITISAKRVRNNTDVAAKRIKTEGS